MGNEQNETDNRETKREASDETDHVVLGRSLEFEVGIGEEFVFVEPIGVGVAFLDFGFVLFRNRIDRCFHFYVKAIKSLFVVWFGQQTGDDHDEERSDDLERELQCLQGGVAHFGQVHARNLIVNQHVEPEGTNPGGSTENHLNVQGILSSYVKLLTERTSDTFFASATARSAEIATNIGATGLVTITLDGSTNVGRSYTFVRVDDFDMRIVPASGSTQAIVYSSGKMPDEKYLQLDTVGTSITLIKTRNDWVAISELGTFSEEP